MTGKKVSCFRERITELISSSGKSQSAIAADFGIARQTLSAWVTGQNSPRTPIVYALSYYFGVSIPWLMGFDVPRNFLPDYAPLSSEEQQLLSAYRGAIPAIQKAALKMLEDSANDNQQKKTQESAG